MMPPVEVPAIICKEGAPDFSYPIICGRIHHSKKWAFDFALVGRAGTQKLRASGAEGVASPLIGKPFFWNGSAVGAADSPVGGLDTVPAFCVARLGRSRMYHG